MKLGTQWLRALTTSIHKCLSLTTDHINLTLMLQIYLCTKCCNKITTAAWWVLYCIRLSAELFSCSKDDEKPRTQIMILGPETAKAQEPCVKVSCKLFWFKLERPHVHHCINYLLLHQTTATLCCCSLCRTGAWAWPELSHDRWLTGQTISWLNTVPAAHTKSDQSQPMSRAE